VAAAQPVTDDTNKNLTDNDTADLKVVNSLGPDLVAGVECLPAAGERGLQKWPDVSNGEEDISKAGQRCP
jgi:hypothetical protein